MNVSNALWGISLAVLVLAFVADFVVVDAKSHAFGPKQAARWVIFYIVAALMFAVFIWTRFGAEYGQQFIAGWVTEYSLSVDNLFVFIVLMSSFAVPTEQRHRVLLVGVAIAIVLRGILIVLGAAAISRFEATFFVFGAFLLYTAIKVWSSDEEPDPEGNALVQRLEKILPVTRDYHDGHLTTKISGKRHITPLFLVMVAVGTTDLLFALDSIPAIFGLTQEAYLVFAANAFALMGLRQLYFLLDGLLAKIIYLSKGLAIILGFISIKLLAHATHAVFHVNIPEVSIAQSLLFIASTLGITVYVSLRAVKRQPNLVETSPFSEVSREAKEHQGEALEDIPDIE
ncbi:MAG: TerC/Alx family metal homeostasis membrane protein [Actinobacteria bacterium]|uniref:Unannotated protein n=1 Tax=freshwater metagenome TaxID=449393 RepID=A0A6J5ZQT4_9ZZZZ|nr:TerC/Alx family metal homeostasis membrane protein [Actinomycetota bacterium]